MRSGFSCTPNRPLILDILCFHRGCSLMAQRYIWCSIVRESATVQWLERMDLLWVLEWSQNLNQWPLDRYTPFSRLQFLLCSSSIDSVLNWALMVGWLQFWLAKVLLEESLMMPRRRISLQAVLHQLPSPSFVPLKMQDLATLLSVFLFYPFSSSIKKL